jgi:transposase
VLTGTWPRSYATTPLLPRQRGNVRLDNFDVVNAILHVAANGCKWRALR